MRYLAILRFDTASPTMWRQWDVVDTAQMRTVARGIDSKHDAVGIAAALNVHPIPAPEEVF